MLSIGVRFLTLLPFTRCSGYFLFYKDLPDSKDGKKQFVIRHSFVFNLDLVEGVEIESLETAGDDFEKDSCAEAICRDYLERESVRLGDSAIPCYSPVTDTVKMPALESFVGQDEYYTAPYSMSLDTARATRAVWIGLKRQLRFLRAKKTILRKNW